MKMLLKHFVISYFFLTNLQQQCWSASVNKDDLLSNDVSGADSVDYDDDKPKRETELNPKNDLKFDRVADPPYLLPEPKPVPVPISTEKVLTKKLTQNVEENFKTFPSIGSRSKTGDVSNRNNDNTNMIDSRTPLTEKPVLFTVANTDTGLKWNQIPYREKFQWHNPEAPCHPFRLRIPKERFSQSTIDVCIYRDHLNAHDESSVIIRKRDVAVYEDTKVSGQVEKYPVSTVVGNIVDTFFYGEIAVQDPHTKEMIVYVIEDITVLAKLVRLNDRVMYNLLSVMRSGASSAGPPVKYNAVVTQYVSLTKFMANDDPKRPTWEPLVIVSTGHTSYLTPGDFQMTVEDSGRVKFKSSSSNVISLEADGSIQLKTDGNRLYSFRPNGRTVLTEGLDVIPLQEKEGSVSLTAFTSTTNYGCLLPTPAFDARKKGGYLCKVCVAVDDLFTKHFKKDKDSEDNIYLDQIIDKVSWIFRSTDWNLDNVSDNIGLDTDSQYYRWSYMDDGQETVSDDELDVLFKSLTNLDFSDCCLGVAYTMKMFPPSTYAKSSASKASPTGGVCSIRTQGLSKNVILISANDKSGGFSELSEEKLVYLTAHEIAKAFGASADVTGQVECDQFIMNTTLGHYILWPDVMRNVTPAEKTFSWCSKKNVKQTLDTCKSSCFEVNAHPFCGNGIVEDGEECDCGSEYNCSLQKCCHARHAKYPCRKTGIKCKKASSGHTVLATMNLISVFVIFNLFVNIW